MMKRYSLLPGRNQIKQENKSGSTGTNTEDYVSPVKESPSSYLLHLSCKTLTIGAFIEAYCNNDLSVLIISGNNVPDENLKNAWDEILFEYSSLIANSESNYLLSLQKKMSILRADITYVENAVAILKIRFIQEIADELISMGFIGDYSEPNLHLQLTRVISLSKNKVVELGELDEEFNRLNSTANGKKQTEEDFNKTIVALSKYIGYRIDKEVVKVDEFAAVFGLYISESTKTQSNGERDN
jgi:hypothetical protein